MFRYKSDRCHVKYVKSLSQLSVAFTIPSAGSKLRTTALCGLRSLNWGKLNMLNYNVPDLRSLVSVICIEIIVQVKILILSSAWSNKNKMAPLSALCERVDYKLVHLNSRRYNSEIVRLNRLWTMITTIFQEKSKQVPHVKTNNWKIFPKPCACTFTDSFSSEKKHCNTSQGFGAFFCQSCDRDWFLFPFISEFLSPALFFLFFDFKAISDCVFNNENNYSTRACWISNNYNHFGATRLVGYLSYPARPRCTQICEYPRAFMTLRVA